MGPAPCPYRKAARAARPFPPPFAGTPSPHRAVRAPRLGATGDIHSSVRLRRSIRGGPARAQREGRHEVQRPDPPFSFSTILNLCSSIDAPSRRCLHRVHTARSTPRRPFAPPLEILRVYVRSRPAQSDCGKHQRASHQTAIEGFHGSSVAASTSPLPQYCSAGCQRKGLSCFAHARACRGRLSRSDRTETFRHRGSGPCCDSSRASRAHSRCCHRPRLWRNRRHAAFAARRGAGRTTERLQQTRNVAVPSEQQGFVRGRSLDDDRRGERQVQEGVVQGRAQRAGRLLLRVSDCFARSDRQQRHDGGTGRARRDPAAVRALLVRVPRLCAAVSTGHVDGAALDHRRQGDADRSHARVQRRARRVELLSQERQRRPRRRARRPLARLRRADAADPQRDRRQAGAGEDHLRAAARHEPAGREGQGRRRVPAHPAVQVGVADRLRGRVRELQRQRSAAGEFALRQGAGREHGRSVREPGGARRRQRRAARVSCRTAASSRRRRLRRSRG